MDDSDSGTPLSHYAMTSDSDSDLESITSEYATEITNTSKRVEQLLTPLRASIINKPPHISGTLQLPLSSFSLFYWITKNDHTARHIDLAHASFDELEQLAHACEPTDTVTDQSHCKARKMDVDRFAPGLVPIQTSLEKILRYSNFDGLEARNELRMELHELNVYSKGSFSDPHINTPCGEGMFGSLIIVFPTPHDGGTLLLRHGDHERSFNYGWELAAAGEPSIGYVAVLGDTEHEVTPVISGHLVTLTYNLYFNDWKPAPGKDPTSEHFTPLPNEGAFREGFEALLKNPEFLADGGTLGFGLRHRYPIKDNIEPAYGLLKGIDAVVYRGARALGFEPILYVLYEWQPPYMGSTEGGLINHPIDFSGYRPEDKGVDITKIIRGKGGIVVCRDQESYKSEDDAYDKPEKVVWVTPKTRFNDQKSAFIHGCDEPALNFVYGHVCLVVRIGKAGERLVYPTSAQLKDVWEREGNQRPTAFWRRITG